MGLSQNVLKKAPFELKAQSFTLPTLRLLDNDMDVLESALEDRVSKAPVFFKNVPIVIDLSEIDKNTIIDFPELIGVIRGLDMLPVGVKGGSKTQHQSAQLMELAILSDIKLSKPKETTIKVKEAPIKSEVPQNIEKKQPVSEKNKKNNVPKPTLVHNMPIRSGQRVYAQNSDLIITAPVSSGAEVIADGNIHIYGNLRGRAIAGAKGDKKACIFCQSLQAELVSIAGNYRISENIPVNLLGKAVKIYLNKADKLIIDAL